MYTPEGISGDLLLCDQWLQLLEELNIAAFTVDNDRRVRSINHSAQALMDLKDTEVLGRDCRDIFYGVPCMVKCHLKGHASWEIVRQEMELPDEKTPKYLITRLATPIYDDHRQPVGCLTILQDHSPIADLVNRLHYEERSLKIILNNLDIGILTVNRGGLITFFNRAAEKISGYDRRQIVGEPCTHLIEDLAGDHFCLFRHGDQRSDHPRGHRCQLITKAGIPIPIQAKYLPLKNEKDTVVGGLATFHDLTLARQLDQAIYDKYSFNDMIGKDPAMQKIFEMVRVVADSDASILIEGATGTGKDILARVLHSVSHRAKKPFIKVNCAALPDNLLESEMFGYAKGAFTGAERDKPGRFMKADGGTLLLDEIGDLPLNLQAKLLRVLEDKDFYPLGSTTPVKVNVRVLSATNRGLERLVKERLFREDLYYRLNVLRIELPPLKQRRSDLPLLIQHIVHKLCSARDTPPPDISSNVMEVLLNYAYPGNVRELENVLEHALIVSQGQMVQRDHLPDYLGKPPRFEAAKAQPSENAPSSVQPSEKASLIEALQQHGGHRRQTAAALGIDRTTLWRKMKKYGLLD